MKPLFKSYLKKVCFVISKKNRVATYIELRSHMMFEFEEFVAKDVSVSEARKKVLASKPNPYWLGYKMRRSQQSFLQRNAISLSFVFVFIIFMIAGQYISNIIQRDYLPLIQQRLSTAKNEAEFEADLRFLNHHPAKHIFISARRKSADDFVYSKLSRLPLEQYVHIFRKFKFQNTPLDAKTEKLIASVDAKWIEPLTEFDYVSDSTPQDVRNLKQNMDSSMLRKIGVQAGQRGSLFLTNELADLTLLYTYRQCTLGACLKGLQALRHVAQLIYSSYSMVAQTKALAMLRHEEYFVNKFKVTGFAALDPEFLNAHERVVWGWRNIITEMLVKNKFSERWQPYMQSELGMCAAINERPFGIFLAGSDLLGKRWFLEEDYSQRIQGEIAMMDVFFEKCDMKLYSDLIHTPNSRKKTLGDSTIFPESVQPWVDEASIPYFRQFLAFYWLQYSVHTSWKVYERLPPKVSIHL